MEPPRHLVAFGQFGRAQRLRLRVAASESAFDLSLVEDPETAGQWLNAHQAHAILVDAEREDAAGVALDARARAQNARVPIIGLASAANDLSFGDVFSWGGDDVVGLDGDSRGLVQRLRAFPRTAPQPPSNGRGTAVVADGDRTRRIVLGRVLRNAGYCVDFAVTAQEAADHAKATGACLVVVSAELEGATPELVKRAHADNDKPVWILSCAPKSLQETSEALSGVQRTAAMDGYAPPENVVFLANELSFAASASRRASARLLYGTTVAFRPAGGESDDRGYSYNISAGGLYVRTLAPPADDIVWLELCPPRTERRVRLVGRIVWRRGFVAADTATVPPGFGVEIVDGASTDIAAWKTGYESFCKAVG
jgi:DNA-binding response OmpR family regulator